ncbi:MAG TPA: PQQ-binding-like beta-propeller repeat protein, partial [Candidatus Bathyarchaeia archaeon]
MNKELERINNKKLTIMLALMFLTSLLAFTPGIEAQQPAVDQWSMFHHDSAHTGYSTSTGPLTNQTLWKFKTGNSVEYSSPSIANGVAYVGSQDRTFYALDAATGDKIWSCVAGNSIKSIAAVANGVVYFGSLDNNVYALDAKTGNQRWEIKTGNQVYSSPNVVDGVVYIGSNDHYVYALNAEDGNKIWSFQTSNFVWSSPAVVNGVVYVTSWDYVYALDASTGSKIWSFKPY